MRSTLVALAFVAGALPAWAQATPPASDAAASATPSASTTPEDLARAYPELAAHQLALEARLAAQEAKLAAQEAKLAAQEAKQTAHERAEAERNAARPTLLGLGPDGFFLGTRDSGFQLRLRTVIQADGRADLGDDALKQQDTFLIRRARLYIEGSVGDFLDYRLMPDFAGGQVVLFDAWVNLRPWSWLQLRAGKFKTPFGLERLQSEESLLFVERSLTSDLAPDRDLGVVLHGYVGRRAFGWELGILNGSPDGASNDGDNNFAKDFVARLFAHPFRPLHNRWLDDFGIGLAASYGKQHGTAAATGLTNFKTEGQQTFFSWIDDAKNMITAVAAGDRYRVTPQLYCYVGPVSLLGEYIYSSTSVTTGVDAAAIANQAWQVAASFVLTLEHPTFDGFAPKRPFDVKRGHVGAFELGARVNELRVSAAAFPNFADPAKSARRAFAWALVLNWYFTRNVRFAFEYVRTTFDGGAAMGDRAPESTLLGRLQVAF